MAVTWLVVFVMLGIVLTAFVALAGLAGYLLSRKQSPPASRQYFWDKE